MSAPTFRHYGALLTSVLLNSATLVLLKFVALAELAGENGPTIGQLLVVLLDPAFILAVVSFLAGVFFWIVALRRLDLSLAYPSVSVSYALIALVSWRLFGEEIGLSGWLGIVTIMVGVTVMFLPGPSATRKRNV
jgi:drug/metabolite transporter (DMT)-like permease